MPAAPGGGWDQTARTIEQVLRATAAVKGVQITNVGGAGGTVGLPQFLNQWKGQGNALMVAGMVMVGAIIANKSPLRLSQATPIARLTGEFQALVVPAQSPFKTAKDFAAALKADPTKVPVAGGSAGGSDHILLGMIAKALGVPPTKVSYVAFAGGGPATAALLGAQVAAGISGYGEFAEQIKAGKLRLIAISSDKRQAGIDAPTLKEEGIDVELFNWRGVFAPPGVNDAQRQAMIALMEKMAASPQWAEACQTREWTPITLARRRLQGVPRGRDRAHRRHPQGARAGVTWRARDPRRAAARPPARRPSARRSSRVGVLVLAAVVYWQTALDSGLADLRQGRADRGPDHHRARPRPARGAAPGRGVARRLAIGDRAGAGHRLRGALVDRRRPRPQRAADRPGRVHARLDHPVRLRGARLRLPRDRARCGDRRACSRWPPISALPRRSASISAPG